MTWLAGLYLAGVALSFATHALIGFAPMVRARGWRAAVTGLVCCSVLWPQSLGRIARVMVGK